MKSIHLIIILIVLILLGLTSFICRHLILREYLSAKFNWEQWYNNKFGYVSVIDEGDHLVFFTRITHRNNEETVSFTIDKTSWKPTHTNLSVNHILSSDINTSITHNFMVSKINNKYVANAGRDMHQRVAADYDSGHDEGIYMFEADVHKDNLDFKEKKLIIPYGMGASQEFDGFNECFSNIVKGKNDKYYIFCRYNKKSGVRKQQVFTSFNLETWDFYNVLELYKDDKVLDQYSIYHMTTMWYNNKFYSLIRYGIDSDTLLNPMHSFHPNFGIYLATSTDGYRFHLKDKILGSEYWPATGNFEKDGEIYMMAYTHEGNTKFLRFDTQKEKFVVVDSKIKIAKI